MVGELADLGATLVAITPQLPEHHRTLIEKHSLDFDLVSDPANAYAARLGIRHEIPDYLRTIYLGFGIDLPAHNGEGSWTLPIPARLVVDRHGMVRVADVDADHTRRPEPAKTLADVAALG